ncbi:hypothetical protein [Nostoc sp. FACHB-133]|uniref:hypothetical protein n=1 Tax=Nostoc sp. FACHB-133 TaxID=2692835 RepID=UPI0016879225|nr:hypothetical protein [Nostoc sp. FACHB-133]MBD2523907.1 hypothetical protein [Nostoc sp. FACHB-133]
MLPNALALLPDALALSTDVLALLPDVLVLSADALTLQVLPNLLCYELIKCSTKSCLDSDIVAA